MDWIFAVDTGGSQDQNQPTSQERGGANDGAEVHGDMVVVVGVEREINHGGEGRV